MKREDLLLTRGELRRVVSDEMTAKGATRDTEVTVVDIRDAVIRAAIAQLAKVLAMKGPCPDCMLRNCDRCNSTGEITVAQWLGVED